MKQKKTILISVITIILILLLGVGIYLLTKEGKKEFVELTAYSCDEITRECNIVSGTTQAIVGGKEGVTHFSLEVTATPTGSRNIINFRIMSDTETPGTTINPNPTGTPGTNAFYESLKNNQATPTQSGATANPYSWDTKICEGGKYCSNNKQCYNDNGCDKGAGEQCMKIGDNKICLIPASEYVGDSPIDYSFTASIEATFELGQAGVIDKIVNSGGKIITIAKDEIIEGKDIFTIDVSESPI